jgi:hypothetical protein
MVTHLEVKLGKVSTPMNLIQPVVRRGREYQSLYVAVFKGR